MISIMIKNICVHNVRHSHDNHHKIVSLFVIYMFVFLSPNLVLSANVEITNDGPGVLDVPLTFSAKLKGDVTMNIDEFVYVFEDVNYDPKHYAELKSGRNVNYTVTYKRGYGKYTMNVQVYATIWGIKGWFITQSTNTFTLQNDIPGVIQLDQNGVSRKTLEGSIVSTNGSVNATAVIHDPTGVFKRAVMRYSWFIDDVLNPISSPLLTYNFTNPKTYRFYVKILANITEPKTNATILKVGMFQRNITSKRPIEQINVSGNTWLPHGNLLQLNVNCTAGTSPYYYCWDIFEKRVENFSCYKSYGNFREMTYSEHCSFPIMHYISKNGTYYVEIGVYDDVDYKQRTIQVNVYKVIRQQQLFFVIIPIISSILAIIIVVGGIAYHLQQRQRYAIEVADFDFQHTEDLNERTFFERVRESFSKGIRGTILHPCTGGNYEDMINDDHVQHQISQVNINPNSSSSSNTVICHTVYDVIK